LGLAAYGFGGPEAPNFLRFSIATPMGARRIFFQGRATGEQRPEGLRRGEVLGKGAASPSPPAGGLGSAVFVQFNF